MGKIAERFSSAFALSLGDHFYFHGVRSEHDPRWRRTFERIYKAKSLSAPGFWRAVAGNHDWSGNVSAQLAYAALPGSRWHYPALQHAWSEVLNDGDDSNTRIDFILIDTTLLCGQPRKPPPAGAEVHWQWVESALRSAEHASYIVVGGHYPVYSPSGHGGDACLQKRLLPLLHQHRASIYLSGHDHAMFHVGARKLTNNDISAHGLPTQFHGVGAGFVTSCSARHRHTIPQGQLRFFERGSRPNNLLRGGFAGISVSATGMTVTHFDEMGEVMYRSTAPPRNSSPKQSTLADT